MTTLRQHANDTRAEVTTLSAWSSFLRAHAGLVNTLDRELAKERGLPLVWYEVLFHLDSAPDHKMRMQELAESALLSFSGLTRLVDRMAEAGLVARAPCAQDRRGSYTVITSKGRDSLQSAMPVHLRGVSEHFAKHLTSDELVVLERAMAKVIAATSSPQRGCCDESDEG